MPMLWFKALVLTLQNLRSAVGPIKDSNVDGQFVHVDFLKTLVFKSP